MYGFYARNRQSGSVSIQRHWSVLGGPGAGTGVLLIQGKATTPIRRPMQYDEKDARNPITTPPLMTEITPTKTLNVKFSWCLCTKNLRSQPMTVPRQIDPNMAKAPGRGTG